MIYDILTHDMAEKYLEFLKSLDRESEYMHYREGERSMTSQGMKSRIKKQENQGNCFTILAINHGDIVGYFSVNGGNSLATRHTASVAIGVLENWRGKGIAKNIFHIAEKMAQGKKIIRFSCSVVWENTRAISFYLHSGFVIIGSETMSFRKTNGDLVNEWILEYLLKI